MPKIYQLSQHVANLIAAGEVVERPASVAKELLENAVDAGASKVTLEIKNGGMTYLRITDNGCGMTPEDAKTAFLRHATSKLRTAEDLGAIDTMGFRGEALAAIASVSRVELMTKTPGRVLGSSLVLEAGKVLEEDEAGCPEGTTIVVRDLFFNTPARMKFMKSDAVEGGKVAAAVQLQALAHPEVSFTFLRDGKQVLQTPGTGDLAAAVYCVYGRESARFAQVESRWEGYSLRGFVCRPTDARPSRSLQTFFVNNRPVKSKLLVGALEEAYRNQILVGKFPACVLHLTLPASAVDVNVHPAKTEVKFLSEKTAYDCVHLGVLGALNRATDRPQVQLPKVSQPVVSQMPPKLPPSVPKPGTLQKPKADFYQSMTAQEYRNFTQVLDHPPQPKPQAAQAVYQAIQAERKSQQELREPVVYPKPAAPPKAAAVSPEPEPEQTELPLPKVQPWRMVGELYKSYILVEQGDAAYLIDKHAAHERILFDKLRSSPKEIAAQSLLTPISLGLRPDAAAALLADREILEELGFSLEEFGTDTVLARQIPMDLPHEDAADVLTALADDLLHGRAATPQRLRDELLHTVACKAAIKAGWNSDPRELEVLVKAVMERDDLKHCPHGRPICITLTKQQLERQFKR